MSKKMDASTKSKWDEMHRELGRFVLQFAFVESHLMTTARILTNAPAQFLRDLVDTWRVDRGVNAIRNLLKTLDYPEDVTADLDRSLKQLKEISNLRNALLHTMTSEVPDAELAVFIGKPKDFDFGGGDFVCQNLMHARGDEAIRIFPVSASIIRGATDDLEVVFQYLFLSEERVLDVRIPSRTQRAQTLQELKKLRERKWAWKMPAQGWKLAKSAPAE